MTVQEGVAAIDDKAVAAKTGRSWAEWFEVLDAFGKEKGHPAMARHLKEDHGLTSWWSQMVTVQYERERGLRQVNERKSGFAVSVSRTVNAPLEKAWNAWAKAEELNRWFTTGAEQDFREGGRYSNADKDSGTFLKIVPHKRIRLTWEQPQHVPGSVVDVSFDAKGPSKTAIVLSHEKLSSKEEVENLREGWSWAMDSLKSYLEAGNAIRGEDWKAKQE